MKTASKILHKQRGRSLYSVLMSLCVLCFSIFLMYKFLTDGVGISESSGGKAALLLNLIRKIFGDRSDLDQITAYLMAGLMAVAALYSLYCLIKGAYHLNSAHTLLGKSILSQVGSPLESISDILTAIDTDMEQGAKTFGAVSISREWILEMRAMRLSRIQGVFWTDQGDDDFVLCCVDDAKNIWAASFTYADDRAHAVKYLQSRFPDLVYGDGEAYRAFLSTRL